MSDHNLQRWQFQPSQVMERLDGLQRQRLIYLERMKHPDSSEEWAGIQDLFGRHQTSGDFRLLYYKYYILSQVIFMTEIARDRNILDGQMVCGDELASNLGPAIDNRIDFEIFDSACQVVNGYITGELELTSEQHSLTE